MHLQKVSIIVVLSLFFFAAQNGLCQGIGREPFFQPLNYTGRGMYDDLARGWVDAWQLAGARRGFRRPSNYNFGIRGGYYPNYSGGYSNYGGWGGYDYYAPSRTELRRREQHEEDLRTLQELEQVREGQIRRLERALDRRDLSDSTRRDLERVYKKLLGTP